MVVDREVVSDFKGFSTGLKMEKIIEKKCVGDLKGFDKVLKMDGEKNTKKRATDDASSSEKKAKYKKRAKYLPIDIIGHILCRMPIKSVVRFRCVSTIWSQIVDDSDFQHSHFNRSLAAPPNVMALSRVEEKGLITMNLSHGRMFPFCDDSFGHIITPRPLDFANTCNGVLCFFFPDDGSILLCNPIIGEIVALPPPPPADPSNYWVGLGFSPSTREHKVIRLSYSSSTTTSSDLTAEVCTLPASPARPWRQVRGADPCPPDQKPLYVDGKIHWMLHQKPRRILSFDVRSELFMTMPNHPDFGPESVLVELGGNLSLVNLSSPTHIEVWVLKDPFVNRWDKLCILSVHVPWKWKMDPTRNRLINMWERGGSLLIWLQDIWMTYDLKTQQQKDIPGGEIPLHSFRDWEMCPGYRVSLVSLKADHSDIVERSTPQFGITFSRGHCLFFYPIRNYLGFIIEKMDIVLKLLPDFARAEPSDVLRLLGSYTRAARADRRLLGPHIYHVPEKPLIVATEIGDIPYKSNMGGPPPTDVVENYMIWKTWMGYEAQFV